MTALSDTTVAAALPALLTDAPALYKVTVTNGSGTKAVEVQGTQGTAWKWAEAAAAAGAFGAGAWHPTAIEPVGPAAGAFAVIA
jgi:hypothetical protein